MRSAEGFISAPGIIALCRDWRLAPRQGNLHFPCDSLRCLPFCVPHESEHLALQAIHFHGVLLTVSGGDTIAIYHCSIKIVSRGKGKSAVAAAAYRAGEKLTNEWDGLTHDYTRKGGVVHSEIMLPPHAPPSFSDRSILWNSVEQIEKSNNSQLAREIEIALPVELSREEQTRLVREYCSSQFVSKGMCADFNIHDTGNGNPHAHILLTMRPLDEKGTWAAKSKKEYVLDENGERVKLPSGRYKTRKVDLMDWNRQENADLWRKAWADLANDYLERSGSAERIDHRSHAERGIEELPTVHMGVAASQMEKKGIATDKGEINRMIQKTNRLMREIRGYIDSLKEWLAEVFAAKKQLQAAPHSPDIATLLTRYLSIEREKSRKYSQGWQQQHTAGELQKISKAINLLCDRADDKYGGRLPVHVRLILDEFANIGQIPNFDKLIATIRSREISASIILQSQSQLKAIYKDAADIISDNCDSVLFLSGRGKNAKEISDALGKETIDSFNTSENRGSQTSHGLNYQKLGKALMSEDEIAIMDGGKCILQLRGVRPFFSEKFDITKHPHYKYLADADKKNTFDVDRFLSTLRRKRHQVVAQDESFDLYEIDLPDENSAE